MIEKKVSEIERQKERKKERKKEIEEEINLRRKRIPKNDQDGKKELHKE